MTRCECYFGPTVANAALARSGLPASYLAYTFDSYLEHYGERIGASQSAALGLCHKWAQAIAENAPQTPRGLYLHGPVGVGKTGLAVSAARELAHLGLSLRYANWRVLLDEARATMDGASDLSISDVLGRVIRPDVLILDDIGASTQTGAREWRENMAYRVLEARGNAGALTLVTSNLPVSGLASELGDRVRDRLDGLCWPIQITGDSLRAASWPAAEMGRAA